MFSWIKSIFSTNPSKIIDNVSSGIDKAFFTDEEKADYKANARNWFIEYLKATQPQNVSRRVIAWTVTLLWSIALISACVAYSFAPDYSKFLFDMMKENINRPFEFVMVFYFGAGIVNKIIDRKK